MENAVHLKNAVFAALAAVGSVLANQLGGWDGFLKLLVACMVVDYATGLIVAGVFKKSGKSTTGALDSKAGFKGLVKKCVILVMVWMAAMMDGALGVEYIRTAVCLFYIANEGLSILENVGLMGVPYPAFLKSALEAMRDKGDTGKTE